MTNRISFFDLAGWLFGLLIFTIGILNLLLVHPVPGFAYLLVSLLFLPPVNAMLRTRLGFAIPMSVKVVLGIVIMWFTLGISDLADMYGI